MNDLLIKIAGLAASAAHIQAELKGRRDPIVAKMVLEMIRIGIQVVEEHTGQPFDLALIKAEEPI